MRYVVLILVYIIIVTYIVHRREVKRYELAEFDGSLKGVLIVHVTIAFLIFFIRFIILNW